MLEYEACETSMAGIRFWQIFILRMSSLLCRSLGLPMIERVERTAELLIGHPPGRSVVTNPAPGSLPGRGCLFGYPYQGHGGDTGNDECQSRNVGQ